VMKQASNGREVSPSCLPNPACLRQQGQQEVCIEKKILFNWLQVLDQRCILSGVSKSKKTGLMHF